MLAFARQRHRLADMHIGRLIGGEGPLPAVLPDRVAVDGELLVPALAIIEHCHRLGADNRQPPLAVRIEPRGKQMAADAARKLHVQMREIRQMIQQRRALPAHFDRLFARDREDHRQIMRRQIPQRVIFGVEFAKPKPVRVDVFDRAKLPCRNQRQQFLERWMEAQHMSHHEHAAGFPGLCHRQLCVRHCQRDRFFNQNILAAFHGAD